MSWINKIFKKQEILGPPLDLSWIGIDMHSHLIPGIDDGVQTMDEALAMVSKMESLGYKKLITTPHIKMDMFPNTEDDIKRRFEDVQETLLKTDLSIEMEVAAEYFLDDTMLTKIENKQLLSFGKEKFVLVEFSFNHPPAFEKEMFNRMLDAGYKPILAHFERYMYFLGGIEMALEYRSLGVNIQLNLNSLSGVYGNDIKIQGEKMLDDFVVDFVGTDAHRMDHLILLEKNLSLSYISNMQTRMFKNQTL